jgi:hypothetical protein
MENDLTIPFNEKDRAIWRMTTEILLAATLKIEPDLVFVMIRKSGRSYCQFSGEVFEIAALPQKLTEFIVNFQTGGPNPCN